MRRGRLRAEVASSLTVLPRELTGPSLASPYPKLSLKQSLKHAW